MLTCQKGLSMYSPCMQRVYTQIVTATRQCQRSLVHNHPLPVGNQTSNSKTNCRSINRTSELSHHNKLSKCRSATVRHQLPLLSLSLSDNTPQQRTMHTLPNSGQFLDRTPTGVCNSMLTVSGIELEQRRHAGHSKWANIKHTKAAKDGAKALLTGNLTKKIRVAIREGGSANPSANLQLARLIEQASKADVPKVSIENAIKSVVKAVENSSVAYYDAKGPGSFMMIIEAFTPSAKRTQNELYTIFRKNGGHFNDKPMGNHFFDFKAVVQAPPGGTLPDMEAAEEAAIMAEAEEVEEAFDDDGNPVFQFICDTKTAHSVKKVLHGEHAEVPFVGPSFRYIPKIHQPVTGGDIEAANRLINALEGMDEIVRVHTNIQVQADT